MQLEAILLIILVVFVIGYAIFCTIYEATLAKKKERKTKIYEAKSERDVFHQIKCDEKENKWEIFDITPLKQTDDYIKVIVIFEVR